MENILRKAGIEHFGVCRFGDCRMRHTANMRNLPREATSVIVCVFPYYDERAFLGNLSAYCAVKDYHAVAGQKLFSAANALAKQYPDEQFCVFCDNSPILEVQAAVCCGLGVGGDNGMLIHPKYGSYVFIGEVVTTLSLTSTPPLKKTDCLHCELCKTACPGSAIGSRGALDAARCASAISQKKGELSALEVEILYKSKKLFGCDICQQVCPMNRRVQQGMPEFKEDIWPTLTRELLEQSTWKERAFGWRGRAVLERNIGLFEGEKT